MLWRCDDCGTITDCDPTAGDDWPDGVLRPVGPRCPDCGVRMDYTPGRLTRDGYVEELDE